MTQVSRTTYKSITASDFPNNTSGLISPADLRGQLDNIADSSPFMVTNKITAPTSDDDINGTGGNGSFGIGDIWVDVLNENSYMCFNNDASSASWVLLTSNSEGASSEIISSGSINASQITTWLSPGVITGSNNFTWNGSVFNLVGNITLTGTVDGRNLSVDGVKLDSIEAGAEINPTASEIKIAYESNLDTNAFTDIEKTKLAGIEAGAEVNTINSIVTGIPGASVITNIVFISQVDYDAILTPSPTTLYVIV